MIERVVSGGQTGVDRAALDAAIELGIEHGGWCPRGRRAEDGPIPPQYDLQETESHEYPVRTERNVVDSDGTLILYEYRLVGGTKLTRKLARRHGRPTLVHDLTVSSGVEPALHWIAEQGIRVMNVAGPRERTAPGIYAKAYEFMWQLLSSGDP